MYLGCARVSVGRQAVHGQPRQHILELDFGDHARSFGPTGSGP